MVTKQVCKFVREIYAPTPIRQLVSFGYPGGEMAEPIIGRDLPEYLDYIVPQITNNKKVKIYTPIIFAQPICCANVRGEKRKENIRDKTKKID